MNKALIAISSGFFLIEAIVFLLIILTTHVRNITSGMGVGGIVIIMNLAFMFMLILGSSK